MILFFFDILGTILKMRNSVKRADYWVGIQIAFVHIHITR